MQISFSFFFLFFLFWIESEISNEFFIKKIPIYLCNLLQIGWLPFMLQPNKLKNNKNNIELFTEKYYYLYKLVEIKWKPSLW